MIQTDLQLAQACRELAQNVKTLYVLGSFGLPMTDSGKKRALERYAYNQKAA